MVITRGDKRTGDLFGDQHTASTGTPMRPSRLRRDRSRPLPALNKEHSVTGKSPELTITADDLTLRVVGTLVAEGPSISAYVEPSQPPTGAIHSIDIEPQGTREISAAPNFTRVARNYSSTVDKAIAEILKGKAAGRDIQYQTEFGDIGSLLGATLMRKGLRDRSNGERAIDLYHAAVQYGPTAEDTKGILPTEIVDQLPAPLALALFAGLRRMGRLDKTKTLRGKTIDEAVHTAISQGLASGPGAENAFQHMWEKGVSYISQNRRSKNAFGATHLKELIHNASEDAKINWMLASMQPVKTAKHETYRGGQDDPVFDRLAKAGYQSNTSTLRSYAIPGTHKNLFDSNKTRMTYVAEALKVLAAEPKERDHQEVAVRFVVAGKEEYLAVVSPKKISEKHPSVGLQNKVYSNDTHEAYQEMWRYMNSRTDTAHFDPQVHGNSTVQQVMYGLLRDGWKPQQTTIAISATGEILDSTSELRGRDGKELYKARDTKVLDVKGNYIA